MGRLLTTQISQLGERLVCKNESTFLLSRKKLIADLLCVQIHKCGHASATARAIFTLYYSLSYPSDQPNHAEEENCAAIRTESSGRWQNRDCSVALPYVCKKRPNATMDPFTTGKFMGV